MLFWKHAKTAQFSVDSIEKKPAKKSPAPPFTTSTLQQEATRKLGFSVSQTMRLPNNFTKSEKLPICVPTRSIFPTLALGTAKAEIISMAGEKYVQIRKFTTKTKGAQEAHEAIRPTYMNAHTVSKVLRRKNDFTI